MNTDGPAWPFGIGEALSINRENGGGLHNFTALHFKPFSEIKDLPLTEWGVPILTKMTDEQEAEFYQLIGR